VRPEAGLSVQWHAYTSEREAARACAHGLLNCLDEALAGESFATLAVAGGATPRAMFEELALAGRDWRRIHLFFTDERMVPPSDPRSNYRLAEEALIFRARVPRQNVHRIAGELPPHTAARRYVDELREFFGLDPGDMPHFDAVHCGLGIAGNTAGLFPGEPLIEDRERIAAAVYEPGLGLSRVTLLPGVHLAAREILFLVTGADKAPAVRAVFHEPYQPLRYPAQVASHHGRRVVWFLDDAAAELMD
jgi:6-phosphogluconolactonase